MKGVADETYFNVMPDVQCRSTSASDRLRKPRVGLIATVETAQKASSGMSATVLAHPRGKLFMDGTRMPVLRQAKEAPLPIGDRGGLIPVTPGSDAY